MEDNLKSWSIIKDEVYGRKGSERRDNLEDEIEKTKNYLNSKFLRTPFKTMINQIQSKFEENRNPEIAKGMEAYMKNKFPFLGIKSPERKEIHRFFGPELRTWTQDELIQLAIDLWELEEREFQYFALDLLKWKYKKAKEEDLDWILDLITKKSWWDTVDMLAARCLGHYLHAFPEKQEQVCKDFIDSENLWLQRSTLIFQLKYKDQTNTELLFKNILILNPDKEFFIQKAIGWSLRELSKTNPDLVRQFLQEHPEIDKLALREASKYL